MILSWRIGPREAATAYELMLDLARPISARIQLTTDGFRVHVDAVYEAFNEQIDYASARRIARWSASSG